MDWTAAFQVGQEVTFQLDEESDWCPGDSKKPITGTVKSISPPVQHLPVKFAGSIEIQVGPKKTFNVSENEIVR